MSLPPLLNIPIGTTAGTTEAVLGAEPIKHAKKEAKKVSKVAKKALAALKETLITPKAGAEEMRPTHQLLHAIFRRSFVPYFVGAIPQTPSGRATIISTPAIERLVGKAPSDRTPSRIIGTAPETSTPLVSPAIPEKTETAETTAPVIPLKVKRIRGIGRLPAIRRVPKITPIQALIRALAETRIVPPGYVPIPEAAPLGARPIFTEFLKRKLKELFR